MKKAPRKIADLSRSVRQRLNMYALAAGAGGVSVLAMCPRTEAKIIYTPVHQRIRPNTEFNLDLNHDGKTDFTIVNKHECDPPVFPCWDGLRVTPGAAGYSQSGTSGYVYALLLGQEIGQPFKSEQLLEFISNSYGDTGKWLQVKNHYLGFRFLIAGKVHYGWARLNVTATNNFKLNATVNGYAYETIPNKPIIAGKRKGSDAMTVQPASLGHLARGSSAISAWRLK
jgi:hypothetical protein